MNHVSQLEDGQKIKFYDRHYMLDVEAALPETFSFSIGNEISSPFSNMVGDGMLSKAIAMYTGASQRIGLSTTKVFMGVEQPEIPVELKFYSYYSSKHEVLLPVVTLLLMASGTQDDLVSGIRKLVESYEKAQNVMMEIGERITGAEKAAEYGEFIKYMRTPSTLIVTFGNVFTLEHAYISDITVTFGNTLDNDFLPMEATVSLTLVPQHPYEKTSIAGAFKNRVSAPRERRNRL